LFSVRNGIHMTGPRLDFDHLDSLLPGACEGLDVVCQGIVDGETPFLFDSIGSPALAGMAHD
jgi:hypothetical protein